jgi:hypothetical protein
MSLPSPPAPAKLVIGFFVRDRHLAAAVIGRLVERFGQLDLISQWISFDYTTYYIQEMGRPLYRRMVAFRDLIEQTALAKIKIATNDIERQSMIDGRRQVNIDPGYLLAERFVLASGKNFSHRIHLDKGIYVDLTLLFERGRFKSLPWTYPDYGDVPVQSFLHKVRRKYLLDLEA